MSAPPAAGVPEPEILRCPSCEGEIDATLTCTRCGTPIREERGVYNLLPPDLAEVKRNEDRVYAEGSRDYSGTAARPWRHVIARHQVMQVARFDEEIVDRFPVGRFLELGGGVCFASAIYKSLHPEAMVYASDVSPTTLRHAAMPGTRLFPRQPDVFAALDAERLPFRSGTFAAIFAMAMMHHLPRPEAMLREVQRVLAPGGLFIAVDHCVPGHFRWLFREAAARRVKEHAIQEELLSYPRWRRLVRRAGLPTSSLVPYANASYLPDPAFALAGRLIRRVPSPFREWLLPVGMTVVYRKAG